ncbi:MAG: DivIVA domain-containing protein, partial [Spirochaetaceae bacterium]|nr:DivIVA domain-containing protein [Spirochaetaceae bacterium]
MPLTPEDVANKQFTSTRLKPGYDETEVDEFLDEVEAELTRLYRENDDLRSRLAAGGGAAAAPAAAPISAPPPTVDPAVARENEELRAKLAAAQRQLSEASQRAATAAQVAPPAQAAP